MVDSSSTKLISPASSELTDAISLVLKDYDGPVVVSKVAEKIKADHPSWTLPDRRVKKFIKKYESENKVIEDNRKMFSPTKSMKRLFSRKKAKATEDADTVEEKPVSEEPVEEPVVEEPPEEEPPAEDPVYVTENESVDSPNDCFAPCAIM